MSADGPIDDRIDVGTALAMLNRPADKPAPYATCPADGEPLISTMERRGAEFVCMVCGGWFGFLAPVPQDPTPALTARYAELVARFAGGERP